MTALIIFENEKKISESIYKDSGYLFKKMTEATSALLVSKDGKRMTKGKIPKKFKSSFSWIT